MRQIPVKDDKRTLFDWQLVTAMYKCCIWVVGKEHHCHLSRDGCTIVDLIVVRIRVGRRTLGQSRNVADRAQNLQSATSYGWEWICRVLRFILTSCSIWACVGLNIDPFRRFDVVFTFGKFQHLWAEVSHVPRGERFFTSIKLLAVVGPSKKLKRLKRRPLKHEDKDLL